MADRKPQTVENGLRSIVLHGQGLFMNIIHLTSYTDLQTAKLRGLYTALSLETEGFIHCSTSTLL